MNELLVEFKSESARLCGEMVSILEECEDQPDQRSRLEDFGQLADRIMGGAKTILLNGTDQEERLSVVAQYTELCKLLGYKGAQLEGSSGLLPVLIALLLDATELLQRIILSLGSQDQRALRESITQTFLERLEWVDSQFDEGIAGTVRMSHHSLDQSRIKEIIEKLRSSKSQ